MTQPFSPVYPTASVPMGIGPPNALYYQLQQSILPSYIPNLDFTTVQGVRFNVVRQSNGTTAQWVATQLLDVTVQGLVAVYPFQVADTPIDGPYFIRAYLSVPSFAFAVPCTSTTLLVTAI